MKNSYYLSLKKIIYLAAPGLSLGTQGLHSIFTTAYGIQFPDQGWNPDPLPWECRVLAIGPPGKSLDSLLIEELETQ